MAYSTSTMDRRREYGSLKPSASKKFSPSHKNRQYSKLGFNLPLNLKYPKNNNASRTQSQSVFNRNSQKSKAKMPASSSLSAAKERALENEPFADSLRIGSTGLEVAVDISTKIFYPENITVVAKIYVPRKRVTNYDAKIRQHKLKAKKISGSMLRMKAASQRGMPNGGTLCYQISLLQALFHQPKLVNFLADSHLPQDCVTDPGQSCLVCAFRIVALAYWKSIKTKDSYPTLFSGLNRLCSRLGWGKTARMVYGMADPDEHFGWIFDQMSTVLPTSPSSSLESIIHVSTTSCVRCPCGYESRTAGHTDRSLSIPIVPRINNGTLEDYIKNNYMIEVVDGYRCDKCHDAKKTKHRLILINHAPEILTVVLKRFTHDGHKISTRVSIGASLDLGAYRDADNTEDMKYDLSAVVQHSGGLTGGHYICNAKGPDGAWYTFDDNHMMKSSLREATDPRQGFTPYLLFYQRRQTV